MKLSQLRALVAAAEQSNFGEAGLQLRISQSAISHAIATLEAELGVQLFSRGRHGANLTAVGERIVAHARQILQLIEGIEKEANLAKGLQGGQLRITSFRSVATHILPEVIAHFHQRFPKITISIAEHYDNPGVEEDLRQGRADIGFVDRPVNGDFEAWELLKDEYVVLLPATFEQPGSHLTWEQLATYPLIMASDMNDCDERVYDHCRAFGKTLKIAYRIRSDSTIVSMVAQGLGATIIPRLAAEPIPAGVKVYKLPVPLLRVVSAVVLTDALLVPSVFAFLDMLKDSNLLASQKLFSSPR